jgi:hypothetical protein
MNPIDPDALPEGVNPTQPKPWEKPQPPPQDAGGSTGAVDGGGIVDAGGGIVDGVGAVADGVGSVLDGASGCLDGCGSCSLAVLVALSLAGSAFAMFR